MRRLFLSDLHLGPEHPDLLRAFRRWCIGPAWDADEIWLLGDLFEYWVGDDIGLAAYADTLNVLADLGERTRVRFIPGNRDFLCGAAFAQRANLQIAADVTVLSDPAIRVAILHGDLLCTGDLSYQRYRHLVHQRWLQWLFLHAPRTWREQLAGRIRQASKSRQQEAAMTIGDVSPTAVRALFRRTGADVIVHGHTHRPASHRSSLGTRYVLPDWRPGQRGSFGWLEQQGGQFSLRTLDGSAHV